jgi:hypothetical protein
MSIEQTLQTKFKETLEIYQGTAYYGDNVPLLCKIHDAFGGLEGEHHNCLGCNFADSQTMVSNYLSKYETYTDIQESITLYILTLYLLVERMDSVMDMVQVPDAYREKHFKVFQQIRKWANFIKHPKAFILTHHPEYDFENSGIDFGKKFNIVVNDQFVTDYYKGESDPAKQKAKNKELYGKLHNQKDIQVIFPDIAQLTKKLCYSINAFAELILKNQVYIDILNDEATISKYFENQQDEPDKGDL